jgi:hypothetical protein
LAAMRFNIANARFLIVILLASLQVADVVSTNHNLNHGALELNPMVGSLMTTLGGAWWLPKAGIMALIIFGIHRASFRAICVTAVIYAAVVINNISQSFS